LNPKNYNPDLVAFYDIQSGNKAGLFWRKRYRRSE